MARRRVRRPVTTAIGVLAVAATMLGTVGCSSADKSDPRAFCAATDKANQLGTEIEAASVDKPDVVKSKVHAAAGAADTAADKAPGPIRDDARSLADALDQFDKQVSAAKDRQALTAAFTTYADTAEGLTDQSSRVEAWVRAHCDRGPGPAASTVPPTAEPSSTPPPSDRGG